MVISRCFGFFFQIFAFLLFPPSSHFLLIWCRVLLPSQTCCERWCAAEQHKPDLNWEGGTGGRRNWEMVSGPSSVVHLCKSPFLNEGCAITELYLITRFNKADSFGAKATNWGGGVFPLGLCVSTLSLERNVCRGKGVVIQTARCFLGCCC